jgi:threonine 3-dehydrogenase
VEQLADSTTSRVLILARPEPGALDLVRRELRALQPDEVVVQVHRAGICGTDLHIVGWNDWAARSYAPPVALGHEFCGTIVETGAAGLGFRRGDRVVAETHLPCLHCRQCRIGNAHLCDNLRTFSRLDSGGFADFTVLPASLLRRVPAHVSDETACLMEPLGIALRSVAEAPIAGADLLVVGCGPIGLLAIAAARALGAARIIASDPSVERRALAERVGATLLIDPVQQKVADIVREATSGGAQVSVDTSGTAAGIDDALASTLTGGTMVVAGLPEGRVALDLTRHVVLREIAVRGVYGRRIDRTWVEMERLLSRPGFDLGPLVTHRFELADYAGAFAAARSRQAGKVMFRISEAA